MSIRKRTAEILDVSYPDDIVGRGADIFLILLIIVNVVAIILESVASIESAYRMQLYWLEVFSVIVFTIEYIARVWSCVDSREGKWQDPLWGRIKYSHSPSALIDLIAILPFYLTFFFAIDLRFLRVVRLLRIFKLTRYSAAMQVLLDVLQEEGKSVFAAFFILFILLILSSSGIYLIEHNVQPNEFGSIPAAMWWSMATLTTVGYGDVAPITGWGKFFGGCITVIGMGMVALPAGILASGFSEQLHRRREEYKRKIDQVMDDGILSDEEKTELDSLREKLNLDTEDTEHLLEGYIKALSRAHVTCPHCGKDTKTENR